MRDGRAVTSSRELQIVLLYTLYKKNGKSSDERAISFIIDGKFLQDYEWDDDVVSSGDTRIVNRIRFERANLIALGQMQDRLVGENINSGRGANMDNTIVE